MINIKGGLTTCLYTPLLEHFVNRSEVKPKARLVHSFSHLLLPKGIGISVTSLVCLFIENLFCFCNIHFKSILARKGLIVVEKIYIVFALTCTLKYLNKNTSLCINTLQNYIVMYKDYALYSYNCINN